MELKFETEIPKSEMASKGVYTITVTNKFSEKKEVYKAENMITTEMYNPKTGLGFVAGGDRNGIVLSTSKVPWNLYPREATVASSSHWYDDSISIPDIPEDIKHNRIPLFLNGKNNDPSVILRFAGDAATLWGSENLLAYGVAASDMIPIGAPYYSSIAKVSDSVVTSSSDAEFAYTRIVTKGCHYFRGLGATGSVVGKEINSLYIISITRSGSSVSGATEFSQVILDAPITIERGDVFSIEYEAVIKAPKIPITIESLPVQVVVNSYEYGSDTTGAPDSTYSTTSKLLLRGNELEHNAIKLRSSVGNGLRATLSTATTPTEFNTEIDGIIQNYRSTLAENPSTAPYVAKQFKSYSALSEHYDEAAYTDAGWPAVNEYEVVTPYVIVAKTPAENGVGSGREVTDLVFYSGTTTAYGSVTINRPVAVQFDPAITQPAGSRSMYVIRFFIKRDVRITRAPLDVPALPPEVKTTLGID